MNDITNPYTPRRRPRHRGWRRLGLLSVVCVSAVLVVLLTACQPPEIYNEALTTPTESTPVANPGGGAVPASTASISDDTGPHSAWVSYCHETPDQLAWCEWTLFMQDPANVAWFEWATTPRPTWTIWDDLRRCEAPDWSGGWSANTGNGYYGGLQFSLTSWRAVGGSGMPHHHSRETQIQMGERLLARQGWGAWPTCSRKLGLR